MLPSSLAVSVHGINSIKKCLPIQIKASSEWLLRLLTIRLTDCVLPLAIAGEMFAMLIIYLTVTRFPWTIFNEIFLPKSTQNMP